MKGQNFGKKSGFGQDSRPVCKRPRVGSSPGSSTRNFRNGTAQFSNEKANNRLNKFVEDEDDPFAGDEFTGEELEELEWVATQAEIKLTQEKQSKTKPNDDISSKKTPSTTNYSFKMPSCSKVNGNPSNFHHENQEKTISALHEQIEKCNRRIAEMEKNHSRKDGEIGILRDRLVTTQKELDEQRVKAIEIKQQHKNEDSERLKFLEREVEKYKDQIQFKHAEMMESQGLIRNLETKNKMLMENQRLGSIQSSSSHCPTDHSSMDWCSTQDGVSGPKKIKLVKPESPRFISSMMVKKKLEDDLGRKKLSTLSNKPATSASESAEVKIESDLNNLRLKSKYMEREMDSAALMHCIMFQQENEIINLSQDLEKLKCNVKSPLLTLLNHSSNRKKMNSKTLTSIMNCINKIIHLPETDIKYPFSSPEPLDLSSFNGFEELIYLINDALTSNSTTQGTSSASYLSIESVSDFENIQAAIQILEVLTTGSLKFAFYIVTQESPGVTEKLLSMNFHQLKLAKSQTPDRILLYTLKLLRNLARAASGQDCIEKFSPFLKKSYLFPLITHENASISSLSLDILTILALYGPFVLEILKEDSETNSLSILGHICHLSSSETNSMENKKMTVLIKIINVLSVLVSEHETLLMEQSCYAEIYHASDVLLYNQLLQWRKDKDNKTRNSLIQRALCLLHSCANVYTDAIPDSRRDHRHQVVLTDLAYFLSEGKDENSFWFRELNRIVKSEVNDLFEEKEST